MSAKIGSLLIDIHANVAQLSKDMAKVQGTVDGALGKVSGTLKAFGGAIAGYFAADKLLTFADATLDNADALAKMATRTGASVEALSGFQHAAKISGVALDQVGQAIGLISQKAVDAANGSSEAARSFAQLGIQFKNGDGTLRSSEELFLDLAEAMKGMPDGAQKSGLAMKLLGEAGSKLIPLLNNGRNGLEAMRKEADELGLTMSTSTAKQAESLNNNMTRLSGVAQGVANNVLAELLPAMLKLSDTLIVGAKQGDGFAKVISTGFKLVASVGSVVWTIFQNVGKSIASVAGALVELVQGNFADAHRILTAGGEDIVADWKSTVGTLGDIWTDAPAPVEEAAEKIKASALTVTKPLAQLAAEAKQRAANVAAALAATAAAEASLTKTRTDDIVANYDAQLRALEAKIADEKTSEAEKNAYLEQLETMRAQRATDLLTAQQEEFREAERRKLDTAQEIAEQRSQLETTLADQNLAQAYQTDDERLAHAQESLRAHTAAIGVEYDARLEALRRNLEDERITEEEYAEQRKLTLAQKEAELTGLHNAEIDKRKAAQISAYNQLAQSFAGAFTDLVFAPLEGGFESLEDFIGSLHRAVLSLIKDIILSGIIKAITGVATGGIGGAVLTALGFSDGGSVRGPGSTTSDSIPAMLSDEEFVIKAKSARKLGLPFLNWLNGVGDRAGSLAHFSNGGAVRAASFSSSARLAGGPVTIAPTFLVQAGGGLLHRELLVRELGPAMRQMAIEQMDSIIRQLGLSPAAVSARG